MAEMDITTYINSLQELLIARKDWMERNEMGKLKDDLRAFQSSFASLYNIYLKKKLINEDPYKQDSKISELEVPDNSVLSRQSGWNSFQSGCQTSIINWTSWSIFTSWALISLILNG